MAQVAATLDNSGSSDGGGGGSGGGSGRSSDAGGSGAGGSGGELAALGAMAGLGQRRRAAAGEEQEQLREAHGRLGAGGALGAAAGSRRPQLQQRLRALAEAGTAPPVLGRLRTWREAAAVTASVSLATAKAGSSTVEFPRRSLRSGDWNSSSSGREGGEGAGQLGQQPSRAMILRRRRMQQTAAGMDDSDEIEAEVVLHATGPDSADWDGADGAAIDAATAAGQGGGGGGGAHELYGITVQLVPDLSYSQLLTVHETWPAALAAEALGMDLGGAGAAGVGVGVGMGAAGAGGSGGGGGGGAGSDSCLPRLSGAPPRKRSPWIQVYLCAEVRRVMCGCDAPRPAGLAGCLGLNNPA